MCETCYPNDMCSNLSMVEVSVFQNAPNKTRFVFGIIIHLESFQNSGYLENNEKNQNQKIKCQ